MKRDYNAHATTQNSHRIELPILPDWIDVVAEESANAFYT
jgi:hypothetical protein